MGNPDFAVPSLNEIMVSEHEVVAVVTSPDKPRGRGKSVSPTMVAQRASDYALPLIQPSLLKDDFFISQLQELKADLFSVVAFRLLPSAVLQIPKIGSVNLHPSLLPQYRGAAPLQWALMNGDVKTGITTFLLSPAMDSGDILMTRPLGIFPEDDSGSLSLRASQLGAHLLVETIDSLARGTASPKPQDDRNASRAPKITSEDCEIDWTKSAASVMADEVSPSLRWATAEVTKTDRRADGGSGGGLGDSTDPGGSPPSGPSGGSGAPFPADEEPF